MVCFRFLGIMLRIDFTAPFLLGILSLTLPAEQVRQTVLACLLHEAAHLITVYLTKQRPAMLTVSAAGMQLTLRRGALCPEKACSLILLSGPLCNLAAGICFLCCGMQQAAAGNLSLCVFNLLPFRGTDGGSFLRMHLTRKNITHTSRAEQLTRILSVTTAFFIITAMHITGYRNFSLTAMILYLTAAEFL